MYVLSKMGFRYFVLCLGFRSQDEGMYVVEIDVYALVGRIWVNQTIG